MNSSGQARAPLSPPEHGRSHPRTHLVSGLLIQDSPELTTRPEGPRAKPEHTTWLQSLSVPLPLKECSTLPAAFSGLFPGQAEPAFHLASIFTPSLKGSGAGFS